MYEESSFSGNLYLFSLFMLWYCSEQLYVFGPISNKSPRKASDTGMNADG